MRNRIPPRLTMVLLALIALLIAPSLTSQLARANGVPYSPGDVFAGVGTGKIKHFSPTGTLLDTLDTLTGCGEDLGMAFDVSGNLYATSAFGSCSTGHVTKFDSGGNFVGPFGSGYSNSTESITLNAAQ